MAQENNKDSGNKRSRWKRFRNGSLLAVFGFIAGQCTRFEEPLPPEPAVSVLDLKGIIADSQAAGFGAPQPLNIDSLYPVIDSAFTQPGVRAVALNINSPGGSPTQSELIADHITHMSDKTGLPVYAFVQDVAASGGYWIACAADEIYAAETSSIGSIGVISSGIGYHELAEKLGIESRVYTAGELKSRMDPMAPVAPEDVEWIQGRLDNLHGMFMSYVEECREGKLPEDVNLDEDIFNGNVWFGREAKERGLIDDIGHMRPVLEEKLGPRFQILHIRRNQSVLGRFFNIISGGEAPSALDAEAVGEGIARGMANKAEEEAQWQPYEFR